MTRLILAGLLLAACAPGEPPGADEPAGGALPTPGDDTAASDPPAPAEDGTFRMVFLADPHIIGDDYRCCEGNALDTESIYRTRARLEAARDAISAVRPEPVKAFVAGDVMHQAYGFDTLEEMRDPANGSAAYHAQRILDGFTVPLELAWGNHDYGPDRDLTHRVFREMFGTEPFHAVEHGGWKFLLIDTQYATETDPMSSFLRTVYGALGREQLAWVADELAEGKPTILVAHHHPIAASLQRNEDPDGPWADLYTVVDAYKDVVRGMFFGHFHRWFDNSEVMGVPAWIIGATRYDGDNFWVAEFEEDGRDWTILDEDKAVWGSVNGRGAIYAEDGTVTIDLGEDPEADPGEPPGGWPAQD